MFKSALDSYGEGGQHDAAPAGRRSLETVIFTAVSKVMIRVIRVVGWGAVALALLGFAGALSRLADLASHFRVAYAFAMLTALATYLPGIARRKLVLAPLILVLVLNCTPIAGLYLPAGKVIDKGPQRPSIHLLQFNTWLKNHRDQEVLSLLEARWPDVISLQETTKSLRSAIADRLATHYLILSAGDDLLLIRRGDPSIRVSDWVRHIIPGGEAIEAQLDICGQEVSLLTFHAMAPIGLDRAATRDAQFDWVARRCRVRARPVIILGDLNATHWSHPFRRLLREGELVDSAEGFGVQPTWRTRYGPVGGMLAWPLRVPIDHCLYSPGFVTVSRETGPDCGSNHFPLFVTLQSTKAAVVPSEKP